MVLQKPMSLPDQLDQAAKYIKKLQINLEKMRERKESLMGREERPPNSSSGSNGATMRLRYPQIKVHEIGSALEVVLITGLETQFMFNEIIRILHEEGAEIVNASFSVLDDVVFHTIHSKVEDDVLLLLFLLLHQLYLKCFDQEIYSPWILAGWRFFP